MRIEPSDCVVVTVSASSIVSDRPCIIQGCVITPAAASCTVLLYDPPPNTQTTTGATLKLSLAGAAAGGSAGIDLSASGVVFNNGCVAVVAGDGAVANVVFAKI